MEGLSNLIRKLSRFCAFFRLACFFCSVVSLTGCNFSSVLKNQLFDSQEKNWYDPRSYFQRATMDQPDRSQKFGRSHLAELALSADGSKLYSREQQGLFKIWDTTTHQLLRKFELGYFTLDTNRLSLDKKRTIIESKVYELETGKILGTVPYEESQKNKLVGFSNDANQIWWLIDEQLVLYDYVESRTVRNISIPKLHPESRWFQSFSPKRTYLLLIDVDQNLHVVNLTSSVVTPVKNEVVDVRTSVFLFSENEQALAIGHDKPERGVRVYQAPDWVKSFEVEAQDPQARIAKPIFFSQKENLLLTEHWSSSFRAYDAKTGRLKYPEFSVKMLYPSIVSPSGKWMVMYPEGDYNLVLYNLSTGLKQTELCPRWCYARKDSGPENLKFVFSADENEVYVMGFDTIAAWSLSQPGKRTMLVDPDLKAK